ncbi:MAG: hypothetical protein H7Y22_12775 [Gemmatimonadaceae bacterium]|nr:hypothetical protein [Gloeobacterales cyanobacterium ES-bin-141]
MSIGIDKPLQKNWITEAVALAATPFLYYLALYSFAFGFASYYDIPIEFVEVDFNTLLRLSLFLTFNISSLSLVLVMVLKRETRFAFTLTVSCLAIVIALGVLIYIELVSDLKAGTFVGALIPSYFVLSAPILLAVNELWRVTSRWVVGSFAPTVLAWVLQLAKLEWASSWIEKLRLLTMSELPVRKSVFDPLRDALGDTATAILIGTVASMISAFATGFWTAASKTDYQMLTSEVKEVILGVYTDRVVIAPIDVRLKQVQRKFEIRDVGGESELSFQAKRVGPLVPRYRLGLVSLH